MSYARKRPAHPPLCALRLGGSVLVDGEGSPRPPPPKKLSSAEPAVIFGGESEGELAGCHPIPPNLPFLTSFRASANKVPAPAYIMCSVTAAFLPLTQHLQWRQKKLKHNVGWRFHLSHNFVRRHLAKAVVAATANPRREPYAPGRASAFSQCPPYLPRTDRARHVTLSRLSTVVHVTAPTNLRVAAPVSLPAATATHGRRRLHPQHVE